MENWALTKRIRIIWLLVDWWPYIMFFLQLFSGHLIFNEHYCAVVWLLIVVDWWSNVLVVASKLFSGQLTASRRITQFYSLGAIMDILSYYLNAHQRWKIKYWTRISHTASLLRGSGGMVVLSRVGWDQKRRVWWHIIVVKQTHLTLGGDRSVPALQATSIWKAKWWKLWELSPPSCSAVALVAEHTKDTSAPRRTSG